MIKIIKCSNCKNRMIKANNRFICRKCNLIFFDKAVIDKKLSKDKPNSDNKDL